MSSTLEFEEEKDAVDAVLASGILAHAPNMVTLLKYVCTKYFEGQQDRLKEYNIAVEAFGRSPDFDQRRDSIVRVEAHRLRKRLDKFYKHEGGTHKVRILIPTGQYVPQFARNRPEEGSAANAPNDRVTVPGDLRRPDSATEHEARVPSSRRAWLWVAFSTALAIFVAVGIFEVSAGWRRSALKRVPAAPVTAVPGSEIRILAGRTGEPYTDAFGHVWQPDRYATGGYPSKYFEHAVEGARDAKIYGTAREGDFQYDIPLRPGSYELRLYFAEMLFGERNVGGGGESTRVFHVDANGKRLLTSFDVISDAAGANVADERVFKDISPDANGLLHLRFTHVVRDPFLNAIEIRPGTPGRLQPIRILMSNSAYLDGAGTVWEADHYFHGGQLHARPHDVGGASDPALYRSQRCGNINYAIPVAAGTYSMTLYFAEGWYGTAQQPFGGGVASRRFNILCNGEALARNFDIFKEAGGAERAVERTFRGLHPSPQGRLELHLQPIESYACVNAIEIRDEGK